MRTAHGSSFLLALALVFASGGGGCDSHGALPNGGSGGARPSGGTTTASGGVGSGGTAGGGGMAGSGGRSTASGGASGGTTTMCYADFPCQGPYRCTGTGYQPTETRDCHSVCGSGPCSGGICASTGAEVACPAGTHCVSGAIDVAKACQPDAPDAAIKDAGVDVPVADADTRETRVSDALKAPLDVPPCEVGATRCEGQYVVTCDRTGGWPTSSVCPLGCSNGACIGDCTPGDYQCLGNAIQKCSSSGAWENVATCPGTCANAQCVESCTAGQQRCKDLVPQTCSAAGLWQDNRACLYLCNGGACSGECTPGSRRCRESTAQACSSSALWADQQACTGDTAVCAGGQCVASCLDVGQDCTDVKTSCCAGSECAAVAGAKTFTCRAVAACTALGKTCTTAADCCAGLDCNGGTCAARSQACLEEPEDGACGGTSGGICCPGTTCGSSPSGCAIPSTTRPQDETCLRDRPSQHEACNAARFGLTCTYSDWVTEPGIFYMCKCSYHGWSCEKNYYVR